SYLMSQTRAFLSAQVVTTSRSSGLKATLITHEGWRSSFNNLPVAASHIAHVQSSLAVAIILPSWLNSAQRTLLLCPIVAVIAPVLASNTFTDPSPQAVTIF